MRGYSQNSGGREGILGERLSHWVNEWVGEVRWGGEARGVRS